MNSDIRLKSVGAIVSDDFATARIFKDFGIDYCCGGSVSLHEACRMSGTDIDRVVEALTSCREIGGGAVPFDSWPTDLIIDYVLKIHHRGIRSRGPQLLALIEKVRDAHSERHPELVELAELFRMSLEDLENHLQKEEQVLFPYCYELFAAAERGETFGKMHCGTVANPIRVMFGEHHGEGTRYKYITNLMNNYAVPADACASYRLMLDDLEAFMDALFEHIHLENNILFPRFVALESQCVR